MLEDKLEQAVLNLVAVVLVVVMYLLYYILVILMCLCDFVIIILAQALSQGRNKP